MQAGPQPLRLGGRSVRQGVPRAAVAVQHSSARASNGAGTVRLEDVRGALLRQEDSIIFAMIERAQFAKNDAVYEPGAVPVPAYTSDGRCFTFLEYFLRDTEATHGRIRRYTSPDEHAFFPEALPPLVRASQLCFKFELVAIAPR
jgi:monofunctional chorismate mutase